MVHDAIIGFMFQRPEALKLGDTIGIIAPSGRVDLADLKAGIGVLKSWGFEVKLGKHIFAGVADYSAGTSGERREDFLTMIADPKVKAVACAIGGYAAPSVLLSFDEKVTFCLKKRPTLLFGYSDFSLFLNSLFSLGIVSLQGPNIAGLAYQNKKSQQSLKEALLGNIFKTYGNEFFKEVIFPGKCQGLFLPTNLESLVSLFGSRFDPLKKAPLSLILALEDVALSKSSLKRLLEQLLLHKDFPKVKGVILGNFSKIGEKWYPKWGKSMGLWEIFKEAFKGRGVVLARMPFFGHLEEHRRFFRLFAQKKALYKEVFLTLPLGVWARFTAGENPCLILS